MSRWRPPRHVSQQSRPHEAQRIVLDQPGAPACPPLPCLQRLVERPESDDEFVVAGQHDVDIVCEEHIVGCQDLRAVQPDLGDRSEALEAQSTRTRARAGDARAIPDVLVVQRLRMLESPATRCLQRLSRRARAPSPGSTRGPRGNASGALAAPGAVRASCQAPIKRTAWRVTTGSFGSPPRSCRTGEKPRRICAD